MTKMLRTLAADTRVAPSTGMQAAARCPSRSYAAALCSLPRASCVQPGVQTLLRGRAQALTSSSLLAAQRRAPAASHFAAQAAATADAPAEEQFTYQAEVDRLMDMIINSLYSNRDIFLRELISNASDALDKMRYTSIQNQSALGDNTDLAIRVRGFPEQKKIVIEDTGIGMTRQEMLDSLGTIARSGTARFAAAMQEAKGDTSLIGKFGVGFYSSFLVADRVEVQSKSNDDDAQWHFESTLGSSSFKITQDTEADLGRGTRVTLHLKEDSIDMAMASKLNSLIKQYSQYIQFPIRLWNSKQESEETPDPEATAKKQAEADEAAKKEGKDSADPVPEQTKRTSKETWDWAVQNDAKPLWTRSPREIDTKEYNDFFKVTFGEFTDPACHAHFSAEGTIEFTAMIFVPGMAPFQQDDGMRKPKNIKLFVRRVFISDEFDESLMPRYLSFVKGLVDSSDLPLNVSREILQESRVVRVIKKQLTKRTLDMLTELAKQPTPEGDRKSDYELFWESFGKYLKLGIIEDQPNRPVLADLMRVKTSKSEADLVSLKTYVANMKPEQKGIYYIAADTGAAADSSPFVEQLQKRDIEVIYLTDVIDEPVFNSLEKYDGHSLIDVTRESPDLGETEEEKQQAQAAEAELKPLMDLMKEALGDRVEKVSVSHRLADSPCALSTSKHGWSAFQERIMNSQLMADKSTSQYMKGRKTLELNASHPIIQALSAKVSSSPSDAKAMTELLFDAAMVTSGFSVESPKTFGSRIFDLMGSALSNGTSSSGSGAASSSSGSDSGTAQRRQKRREANDASPPSEPITADSVIPPSENAAGGSSPWGN